jgi:hypothetical protein
MHATRIPRRLAAAALACCLAPLTAAPALAQSEQEVEAQSFRIPGWSFTPALAVGVVHDTNVALTSPQASLGETEGDSLFNIVPSGRLEYLGKRGDFSAAYRGFLRRYVDVEGLDGFDQRATIGFKRAMSRRVSVFGRNSFADSPTTDEVEVNGVPFRRTGSRSNTLVAGADVRLTKLTTVAARYDMTWVEFDQDAELAFLTGGWIHGVGGDVSRQVSERLSLGGEYSYRIAEVNEGSRNLSFQNVGGVVRFVLREHTSATAAGGFATLHDRIARDTRTGPYVRLGITHRLEHATVGAAFERQYVPSFGFGGASSSQDLRAYVLMPLSRNRVYVQGSAAWRRTLPFEATALELDTVWLRSTVGYAATRWARVEAVYTYARQDSIITGGEVDRHRVGAQLVISQPMRIR